MSILTRDGFHALQAEACALLDKSRKVTHVLVCAGPGCIASGAMKVYECLKDACQKRGLQVSVQLKEEAGAKGIHLKKSGCHGFCEIGPLVNIEPLDILYTHVKAEDCEEIVEKTILGGQVIDRLLYKLEGQTYQRRETSPSISIRSASSSRTAARATRRISWSIWLWVVTAPLKRPCLT